MDATTQSMVEVNFEVYTNADWSDQIELSAQDEVWDLTGAEIRIGLRRLNAGPGQAVALQLTSAGETPTVIIENATAGIFSISVPAATMATLSIGEYEHDCIVEQGGNISVIWRGRLKLLKGVSV